MTEDIYEHFRGLHAVHRRMRVVEILEEVVDSRRTKKELSIEVLRTNEFATRNLTRSAIRKVDKELGCHGKVTVSQQTLLPCLLLARRARKIRPVHVGDANRFENIAPQFVPLRDLLLGSGRLLGSRRFLHYQLSE